MRPEPIVVFVRPEPSFAAIAQIGYLKEELNIAAIYLLAGARSSTFRDQFFWRPLQLWHDLFTPPRIRRWNDTLDSGVEILTRQSGEEAFRRLGIRLGVAVDACTGIPTAADLRYLPLGLLDSDWQITHFGGDLAGDYGVFEVVVRHVKQNGTTIVERTPQHMERFDNDESLAVKARVLGAKMLRHACRSLTRNGGLPPAEDQQWHRNRMGKGETRRRQFANASAIRTPLMSAKSQVLQRAFQLFRAGATLMLLPYIAQKRRKLESQGRAPVMILYYHGVGNGAESWATFPLEMFDRQVAYCYWYSKLIGTSDAVDGLRGARVRDAAVVLT